MVCSEKKQQTTAQINREEMISNDGFSLKGFVVVSIRAQPVLDYWAHSDNKELNS